MPLDTTLFALWWCALSRYYATTKYCNQLRVDLLALLCQSLHPRQCCFQVHRCLLYG